MERVCTVVRGQAMIAMAEGEKFEVGSGDVLDVAPDRRPLVRGGRAARRFAPHECEA